MTSRPTRTLPTIRSAGGIVWPGITSPDGHPDCYYCSWAFSPRGRMEVKYVNAACPVRAHLLVEAGRAG